MYRYDPDKTTIPPKYVKEEMRCAECGESVHQYVLAWYDKENNRTLCDRCGKRYRLVSYLNDEIKRQKKADCEQNRSRHVSVPKLRSIHRSKKRTIG